MQWNVNGGVQTAGNFRWSVDDWLKGDVVDEIDLFTPASDAVIARLMEKIREQQSPVRLTVFRSRGNLPPESAEGDVSRTRDRKRLRQRALD